jgi:TrmH family RNA methyltransferase
VAYPHPLLRSLLGKKGRREHGLFLIEGPSLLREALDSGLTVREVRISPDGRDAGRDLLGRAEAQGARLIDVSPRALASLSDLETPTGMIAVAELRMRALAEVVALPGLVLLLAGVGDPGNAGTLVRAAEAFGASGVIFGSGGAEPYNPKVVRAAMGSLFRVRHAVADPGELDAAASGSGRKIVAADRSGAPLRGFDFPERPILAVGAERGGVGAWLLRWDAAVGIPHVGPTESLNAAVAGSIVLYEWSCGPSFRSQN